MSIPTQKRSEDKGEPVQLIGANPGEKPMGAKITCIPVSAARICRSEPAKRVTSCSPPRSRGFRTRKGSFSPVRCDVGHQFRGSNCLFEETAHCVGSTICFPLKRTLTPPLRGWSIANAIRIPRLPPRARGRRQLRGLSFIPSLFPKTSTGAQRAIWRRLRKQEW